MHSKRLVVIVRPAVAAAGARAEVGGPLAPAALRAATRPTAPPCRSISALLLGWLTSVASHCERPGLGSLQPGMPPARAFYVLAVALLFSRTRANDADTARASFGMRPAHCSRRAACLE